MSADSYVVLTVATVQSRCDKFGYIETFNARAKGDMLEGFGNLYVAVVTPLPEERFVRVFKVLEIPFPLFVGIHAYATVAGV